MKELFLLLRERLLSKEPLVLATVIGSAGSTPRGAGARMLVGMKGQEAVRLWGTIGGGLPEHEAITEAAALLKRPGTLFKKYILHPGEAADLGARCGGEVSVFFRSLDAGEPLLSGVIEQGIGSFKDSKAAWLIMEVYDKPSASSLNDKMNKLHYENYFFGIAGKEGFLASTGKGPENLEAFCKSAPVCLEDSGKLWFSEPLVSGGFVYVFGGGHVAQELVPLLSHLDFRCVVFDDREEFTTPELFPSSEKLILGDFKQIEKSITFTEKDCAVIVTRGHLWDLEAWAFALGSPAAYIGVIGSKTKHEYVKGQLRERGFSPDEISSPRVHAPIGLDIKSDTPAEIAVSIAAELILERAKRK